MTLPTPVLLQELSAKGTGVFPYVFGGTREGHKETGPGSQGVTAQA